MSKRRTVNPNQTLETNACQYAEQEKVMTLFSPKPQKTIKELKASQIKPLPLQQDVEIASTKPEEDVLDWDFYLKAPPPRSTGTIELKFKYGGRSKPIPVTDPWDE